MQSVTLAIVPTQLRGSTRGTGAASSMPQIFGTPDLETRITVAKIVARNACWNS